MEHHTAVDQLELMAPDSSNRIVKFLAGKHILVTGATGFIAKVMVEKILRVQPHVGGLYLLLQPKPGKSVQARLQEVLFSPVFKALRDRLGQSAFQHLAAKKLHVVQGNVAAVQLGLQHDMAAQLQQTINIIVHSAANTKFFDRYDELVRVNARGAQQAAAFAAGCANLSCFINVSSAFVNQVRKGVVFEQTFDPNRSLAEELAEQDSSVQPAPPFNVLEEMAFALDVVSRQDDATAHQVAVERAQRYGWGIPYTLTKSMGEMLVGLEARKAGIPVAIIRPSVTEGAVSEPMPGWLEGFKAADPLILAYGQGWFPGVVGASDGVFDVVPVDYVANAIIAAMYHTSQSAPGVTVYHMTSSQSNPLTRAAFCEAVTAHFNEHPLRDAQGCALTRPGAFSFMSQQEFEAAIGSWEARTQKKALRVAQAYSDVLASAPSYSSQNAQELYDSLRPSEQALFEFDVRKISWQHYLKNVHIPGLRNYVATPARNVSKL